MQYSSRREATILPRCKQLFYYKSIIIHEKGGLNDLFTEEEGRDAVLDYLGKEVEQ